MLIAEVESALEAGVRETINTAFDLSKDIYRRIYPEYLKTIKIAEALRREADPGAIVSLEESTNSVLGRSILWPRPANWTKTLVTRPGKVDICVMSPNGDRPVIVVETKRYVKDFKLIAADALRCTELLKAANLNGAGTVAVAACTYFVKADAGYTSAHHQAIATPILQDIESQAKALAHGPIQHKHIHFSDALKIYASDADANVLDDDDVPAHVLEPALTVFGGIELYWRDDRLHHLAAL